jgi:hypothetical protein
MSPFSLLVSGNTFSMCSNTRIARSSMLVIDLSGSTPLRDEELDVAVFSISLMGLNWPYYIREAKRCLADNGYLMIAETTRSLSNRGSLYGNEEGRLYGLKNVIDNEGFEILSEELRGDFTFITPIKRTN